VLLKAFDAAPAWVMGDVPNGARRIGEWNWHDAPTLLSSRSHAGPVAKGQALHYFLYAPQLFALAKEDNLVQYVYLDPKNPPKQILLQLYGDGAQLGKRVYWGDDRINLGAEAGVRIGALPETGKWVRLRIPLDRFGVTDAQPNGFLFGQFDGRAFWGPTTRSPGDDAAPPLLVLEE
jgi:hypothetical protein